MNILGIDASVAQLSMATYIDNKIENFIDYTSQKIELSGHMFGAIESVLGGFRILDFDYVIMTVGPGSFTDLRMVVSLGKGLSIGLSKEKIIGCSFFDILSQKHRLSNPLSPYVATCMCPSSKKIYGQLFRSDGHMLEKPRIYAESCFLLAKRNYKNLSIIGNIPTFLESIFMKEDLFQMVVNAKDLCIFSSYFIKNNNYLIDMSPVYIRKTYVGTE